QRDEAQARAQHLVRVGALPQLPEQMRRQRATAAVAAARVDQAEERDLAAGEPRQPPGLAAHIEHGAFGPAKDALQAVTAWRRRHEPELAGLGNVRESGIQAREQTDRK